MYDDRFENAGEQMPTPPSYPYPIGPDPWATIQFYQMATQAVQAERDRAQFAAENLRLRNQLAQRTLAEDAFTTTGSTCGHTFTVDKHGRMIELMNAEIEYATHAFLQPPFASGELYTIKLKEIDYEIVLHSADFHRDSVLIQAFQETAGVQVRFCRTAKLTATLLRQAIAQRTQVMELSFYAGWRKSTTNGYNFWTFDDGSTHVRGNVMPKAITTSEPMTAASMMAACFRFQQALKLDLSQPAQWLLGTIFHIAALTSLLQQIGCPFPLALCVLTDSAVDRARLKSLFGWYGDEAVSLTLPFGLFSEGVICRKDQPLVILDDRGNDAASKNSRLLEAALISHQLPYTDKRMRKYVPLQSLPIILSSTASALTTNPDCITLDLPSNLSDSIGEADEAIKSDYLRAFTQYVEQHIDRLKWLLDEIVKQTFQSTTDMHLDENCVCALGILLAVDISIHEFYTFCGMSIPPLYEACPDADEWLLELFAQTAEKVLDHGDLAAQFIDVAKAYLQSGTLHPCPIEYETYPAEPVVFYNNDHLFFTTPAMRTVSGNLGQSQPVMLRALTEAGLLQGKPINAGTQQTRISIWNAYGVRKTERVYKLPRSAFDQAGDPLIFEGEESK